MAHTRHSLFRVGLLLLILLVVSACNLTGSPEQEQLPTGETTLTASPSGMPSRTPASTSGLPTLVIPTNFPTLGAQVPTRVFVPTSVQPPVFPSATPLPVSIMIISPTSGNIVAGNVQVLGSAIHPQFLQYQLEYGPDPNPNNLWFPATNAVTTPRLNELLGIWNTTTVQDARYQLRLRVFLRDGIVLTTVVGNITVQNRVNTPVPTATQNIPRPIAAFTQNRTTGDAPLTVQFTNQSTGSITGVQWSFGDGTGSQQVSPSHTFQSPGRYNVTLTVTGPGGTSNVSREIDVTSPSAPVAGFTQDRTSGVAPLTVQFSDRSTGNITSYLWNFSDGTTSTVPNPTHTFTVPGTYNVILTVAGPGGTSSVTRQITVSSPIPPTLTSSPTWTLTPTVIPPVNTATFTPTVIPPEDTATSVVVLPTETFTPTATTIPPTATFTETPTTIPPTATFTETATTIPPTATFTETATTVPPTATFTDTATMIPPTATFTETATLIPPTATFTETPTDIPPTATFTATPTFTETPTNTPEPAPVPQFTYAVQPDNPLAVQFTNQSTGNIASVFWEFGDGATSTEQNPQHIYPQGGTYTVTLTVTGADGQTAQTSQQVTVEQPLQPAFSAAPVPDMPLTVQFTDQSVGNITEWFWEFGDGGTSPARSPQHTYAQAGTYTVTLTVTSESGRTAQTSQQVTVEQPLQAAFSAAPVADNPLAVQFTDQSTGNVTTWFWDFGDSATSTEQNPQHIYPQGGTYTVTLTVTGETGAPSQTSQQVTVEQPLQANFTTETLQPGTIQFTDQSTGEVSSWFWEFGDGGSSTEQNPQYTYTQSGTYNVRLVVTDVNGRTAETTQQVTVEVPQVEPTTPPPGLVDTTPIMPDLTNQALANQLMNIISAGAGQGLAANAFAVAGSWFDQATLLDPFAPTGTASNLGGLQNIVDFYNARDYGGATSFNRSSYAVRGDWSVQALLDPNQADPSVCAGASPLECEITQSGAAVILIGVGVNDIRSGIDVNTFRDTLNQVVSRAINRGVIPVLYTIAPPPDVDPARASAINSAIIEVAAANNIPVINAARALGNVPNAVAADGTLLPAPTGAGDLSDAAADNFGANRVNQLTLRLLRDIRQTFLPSS